MSEDTANGPFILWADYGCEGWKPRSFETLAEAVMARRYGEDFVITKLVHIDVTESPKPHLPINSA